MNEDLKDIPQEILSVLNSADLSGQIYDIGEKYKLHIDQEGELEVLTRLLMIGKVASEEFVKKISEKVEVNMETSAKIADEINQSIILPIKTKMKETYGNDLTTLNKESILQEIEDPVAITVEPKINSLTKEENKIPIIQSSNLIEDKMTQIVRLPQETVDNSKPPNPSLNKASVDPYREPLS